MYDGEGSDDLDPPRKTTAWTGLDGSDNTTTARRGSASALAALGPNDPQQPRKGSVVWTGFDDASPARRGSTVPTPDTQTPRKGSVVWTGFDDTPDRRGSTATQHTTASSPRLGYKAKAKGSVDRLRNDTDEEASPNSSRRGSKSAKASKAKVYSSNGETLIATKKPRTGKTVLRPGMTARNYLDGETPIASAVASANPSTEGFIMEPTNRDRRTSWAGQ